jgi:hypothetical protein
MMKMKTQTRTTTKPHTPKRSTKKSAPAPVAPPEPTAPAVDEAPRCNLCESPAAEGATLCPACEETDQVGRNADRTLGEDGNLAVSGDDGQRAQRSTKTAAPLLQRWPAPVAIGEAVKIGAEVARYLKIHSRKPYEKEQDVQWMIDRARAAWHAALIETASVDVEGAR